jgi:hypothetical protein
MKLDPQDLEAWLAYFKLLIEIEQSLEGENVKIEKTGGSEGI